MNDISMAQPESFDKYICGGDRIDPIVRAKCVIVVGWGGRIRWDEGVRRVL